MTKPTKPIQWSALSTRERDSLVAEKVMGWKRTDNPDVPDNDRKGHYFRVMDWHVRNRPVDGYVGHYHNHRVELWSPTTDPKACAEVIEAMRKKGWAVTTAGSLDGKWVGEFWQKNPQSESGLTSHARRGQTMPEAVSLAALRSVGVEIAG